MRGGGDWGGGEGEIAKKPSNGGVSAVGVSDGGANTAGAPAAAAASADRVFPPSPRDARSVSPEAATVRVNWSEVAGSGANGSAPGAPVVMVTAVAGSGGSSTVAAAVVYARRRRRAPVPGRVY